MDSGLIGAGVSLLVAGYGGSLLMAGLLFDHDGLSGFGDPPGTPQLGTVCYDQAGAWSVVPVIGALIGGIHINGCDRIRYEGFGRGLAHPVDGGSARLEGLVVLGVLSTVAQLVGTATVVVAAVSPTTFVVWDNHDGASVELTASGSGAGASVGVRGRMP